MDKLSELSKPAWIVGEKEIADFMSGDEALLVRGNDPESTEPALRMYSQEYVSALLARIEELEKKDQWSERQSVIDGLARAGESWADIEEYMQKWDAEHRKAMKEQSNG